MHRRVPLSVVLWLGFVPTAVAGDEPAVQGDENALPYLQALHGKVHRLWTDNFLAMAAAQLPKDHPVNMGARTAELGLTLTGDGKLLDATVSKPSGSTELDAAAIDVVKTSAPYSEAPDSALSDDGKIHIRWVFARDDRRCSGISLEHRELAATDAVRTMVQQGRIPAAIARLQASDDTARAVGLDAFARAWLDKNENDRKLAVDVAAANAIAGDDRGARRLRSAATAEPTAAVVRGLAALKIPICPLIEDLAAKHDSAEARERFLWALGEGTDGECLKNAIASAANRSASRTERVLAIASLGRSAGDEVKAALKALLDDKDAAVKAAAILAEARPGAGKGAVFRLTPLLRDKAVAVRAAAAAALVRVGGEEALPQLFLIAREKDSLIFTTLAPELGALSGQASAEMLGKLLRKDDLAIKLAAARALARRRDEHAAKVRVSLTAAGRADLQLLAGLALDKEKRAVALAAPIDEGFAPTYAALLRGGASLTAGDWLLEHFQTVEPSTRTELLGQWLARDRQ